MASGGYKFSAGANFRRAPDNVSLASFAGSAQHGTLYNSVSTYGRVDATVRGRGANKSKRNATVDNAFLLGNKTISLFSNVATPCTAQVTYFPAETVYT